MKLEPANIVCPTCGNKNYMHHLIGKNVGYWDMKCINCNSYFNFDELYNLHIGEVLKPKPVTNGDKIRSMTDEELVELLHWVALEGMNGAVNSKGVWNKHELAGGEIIPWLEWLKQEVTE